MPLQHESHHHLPSTHTNCYATLRLSTTAHSPPSRRRSTTILAMASQSVAPEALSTAATTVCSRCSCSSSDSSSADGPSNPALNSALLPDDTPSTPSLMAELHVPPPFVTSCNGIVSFPDAFVITCVSSASSLGTEEQCCRNPGLALQDCQRWATTIRDIVNEYAVSYQGTNANLRPSRRSTLGIIRLACVILFLALYFVRTHHRHASLLCTIFINLLLADAFYCMFDLRDYHFVRGNGAVLSTEYDMLYVFDRPRSLHYRIPMSFVSCFRMTQVHWKAKQRLRIQPVLNSERCSYSVEIVTMGKTILLGNCADKVSMASFVEEANSRLNALRECGMIQSLIVPDMYGDEDPYSALQMPVSFDSADDQILTTAQMRNNDIVVKRKQDQWVEIRCYRPGRAHYLPSRWVFVHPGFMIGILITVQKSSTIRAFLILNLIAILLPVNYNSILWRTFVGCTRREYFSALKAFDFVLFRRHQVSMRDVTSIALNRLQVEMVRPAHAVFKHSTSTVSGQRMAVELRFKCGKMAVLKPLLPLEAMIIAKELHRLCHFGRNESGGEDESNGSCRLVS